MAEGIVHSDGPRVVVAVADVDALAVPDVAVLAGEVEKRRGIGEPDGNRLRKLAGRVDLTEQDISDGVSVRLTGQPKLDDRADARRATKRW